MGGWYNANLFDFMGGKKAHLVQPFKQVLTTVLHSTEHRTVAHFAYQANYILKPFASEENTLCFHYILKTFIKIIP